MNRDDKLRQLKSVLLSQKEDLASHFAVAAQITREVFGNRRVLLNPVYFSNKCINDCCYCQFRRSNRMIDRKSLTHEQAVGEINFLMNRGIARIIFLSGELPLIEYHDALIGHLEAIRKSANPGWIAVEAALPEDNYRELKQLGVDAVSLFQETYDRKRYEILHAGSAKADFGFRFGTQYRAARAGIEEVGFGILLGIGNWMEDCVSMASHALSIQDAFPQVRLMFSFPRLIPFDGIRDGTSVESIGEDQVLRALTAFRVAFPKASLVISGRESSRFLLVLAGIANVIGKGGSTSVGGYLTYASERSQEQFLLNRDLNFSEFKALLRENGYVI
jgi:2-iminoacetate synthase